MDRTILDLGTSIFNAALRARKIPEFWPFLVPAPPFGVGEVENVRKRRKPVSIVDRDYPDFLGRPRFFNTGCIRSGKTRPACDADNGCAVPGSIDDAESVDWPSGAALKDFFSAGSKGLISLGPATGRLTGPG